MYETRRPLIGISIIFSLGVLLGKCSHIAYSTLLFTTCFFFVLAFFCNAKPRSFFIFLIIFGLGCMRVVSTIPDSQSQIFEDIFDRPVQIQGKVFDEPFFILFLI